MNKARSIFAGFVVAIILFSALCITVFEKPSMAQDKILDETSENTVGTYDETSKIACASLEEDNTSLPINVTVKVFRIFKICLIKVSAINLGDEHLTLGTSVPGGFVVYDSNGREICRKPRYTIAIIRPFYLKPHEKKTLFRGIWIVPKYLALRMHTVYQPYAIYGELFSYEYKGEQYPPIRSSPITIYP